MGCHTWFYQKSNRTRSVQKELTLKTCEENLLALSELALEFNAEEYQYNVKYWTKLKRMIEKDIINPFYIDGNDELSFFDKDKGFFIEGNAHDIFRVRGYPEERFFDFESLKKWIMENKKKYSIEINENQWIILEEYWKKYPDSMVEFG